MAVDAATQAGVDLGTVEGVGHLADELDGTAARQARVGIERDDVADAAADLRDDLGHDDEACTGDPAQETIEFVQLAALALPAHPFALPGIPDAPAVQQQKARFAVLRVEICDAFLSCSQTRFIKRRGLGIAIFPIGEQRQIQIAVSVGEIVDFQRLQLFFDGLFVGQECRARRVACADCRQCRRAMPCRAARPDPGAGSPSG